MPICDALFLAIYLFEIGPSVAGNTITHGEIESWQHNTGIELDSWQARTLRRLSSEYLKQCQAATARDCPAPWISESVIEQTRKVVDSKFRTLISNSRVTRE